MNLFKKNLIKSTPNASTITATDFSKEVLIKETNDHISAVSSVMNSLAKQLQIIGFNHDWTKLPPHLNDFFEAFKTHKQGKDFEELPWYVNHVNVERHHLVAHCPDDVNLLDVLEMIVDGVCAGKARTGIVYPIEIPSEILQKALANTQKMIEESITLE